ncbi:ankyrin repeat domain-containing protein [Flavobacterium litorale]|uniref:Ankyrin repeat domain-containing protein n=1 Tax=Flavobacterium litorale TaxID=2856519 RepID=A0ABX8V589_9FLAO|nr:ankyrin repeat domain-containing protein [Flavobacterium litorale]QYJ68002.1 ankyrin repeat domain-containing protein [Flavobacterium litorale]
MKKTIIYLSLALVAFGSTTFASNANNVPNSNNKVAVETVVKYNASTPLAMAICKGDVTTVKKFIEYGADVNEKSNGFTPLMLAARYNRAEIVKILIANGAKLKITDDRGFTALKHAELSNANESAVILKEAIEA